MPSEKRKFGDICEKIAAKHLTNRNFDIVDRNYRKKWGELDIVAKNGNALHFIEVKGTSDLRVQPEENIHSWKQKRLWRAIQTWLLEHPEYEEAEWQIDVMAVFLDLEAKKAKIRWTKNIILG